MAVNCGGKFGVTSLLATRKRNSGGKLELSAKFATRAGLEQPWSRIGTAVEQDWNSGHLLDKCHLLKPKVVRSS